MENKKEIIKAIPLTFGTLAFVFLISYLVLAWTEPTSAPPFGNVPAPLNVSTSTQTKLGPLVLNQSGISPTGLIVNRDAVFINKVSIGTTTSPTETLEVSGNVKNEGIILQPLSSLPTCDSAHKGRMVYYNDKFQYCNGSFWKEVERVTGYTRVRTCLGAGRCSDWCDIGTDCSSYPCSNLYVDCPEGYLGSSRPVTYTYKGSNRIKSYIACYSEPNCTGSAIPIKSDDTQVAGAPSLQEIKFDPGVVIGDVKTTSTAWASLDANLDFNSKIIEKGYDPEKVKFLTLFIVQICEYPNGSDCTDGIVYYWLRENSNPIVEESDDKVEGVTRLYIKRFPFNSSSSYRLEATAGRGGENSSKEVVIRMDGIWIEQ